MALYWLTYKRNGRLVRVAIVSAESMTMARSRAELAGIHTGTMFAGGHVLEPEFAARVPPDCIGRKISRTEAVELLDRIARATGHVR
jgi:hypothetical protein